MRRIHGLIFSCASAALGLAQGLVSAREPDPKHALGDIDKVVEQALHTYQVPGLSIAVVIGDEVVHLKGYGYRDAEKKLPMEAETQMPIASITKQFTVAALGTLA